MQRSNRGSSGASASRRAGRGTRLGYLPVGAGRAGGLHSHCVAGVPGAAL